MLPRNKIKIKKEKHQRLTLIEMHPSITSLIAYVTNLTIAPLVGQSDLNENKQRDVSVEPGSTTNMERELLSDATESKISANKEIQKSPTFEERMSSSMTFKKKQGDTSTLFAGSAPSKRVREDEPPKVVKFKLKSNIWEKWFKGKNNQTMAASKTTPTIIRPSIVIQTPDIPDSSKTSPKTEEIEMKPFLGTLSTPNPMNTNGPKNISHCNTPPNTPVKVPPKIQISRKTFNIAEPTRVSIEKDPVTKTECKKELSISSKSKQAADFIISSLNQPSTSKQMYIPFDEFCKMQSQTLNEALDVGRKTGHHTTSTTPAIQKGILKTPESEISFHKIEALKDGSPAPKKPQQQKVQVIIDSSIKKVNFKKNKKRAMRRRLNAIRHRIRDIWEGMLDRSAQCLYK